MKIDDLKSKYSQYLKSDQEHEKVGWGSKESQILRFQIISEISEDFMGAKILDYGCGLGGLLKFLEENKFAGIYTGYDVLQDMVDNARALNPNGSFDNKLPQENFDYVVASGVFAFSSRDSSVEIIRLLYEKANKGVAVNFLSAHSTNKEEDEFYCKPGEFLDLCMTFCGKIVLRHDYLPHDFTVYLYK